MNTAFNVATQVFIMFLLMGVGVLCEKTKIINRQGADQLASLIVYIVTPCVIIHSYQMEFDSSRATGLLLVFGLAVLFHVLGIVISKVLIPKKNPFYREERFSVIYANCGYLGLPLVMAVFPETGAFYLAIYIAVFNLFLSSQGISLMSGQGGESLFKIILKTPIFFSVLIGLVLFVFSIPLPLPVGETVKHLAGLNTPLAMIMTGIFIARTNIRSALMRLRSYFVLALRLLVIPAFVLVSVLLLSLPEDISGVLLIAGGAPSAAISIAFASKYKRHAELSGELVSISSLISIATLPAWIFVYGLLS